MSQTLHQTKLRALGRGTAERYLRSLSARFLIRAASFSDRGRSGRESEGPRANTSIGEWPDRLQRRHPGDLVRNLFLRRPPVHLRHASPGCAIRRHTRPPDRGRGADPGRSGPHSSIRPRRRRGRTPPHPLQPVVLQSESSCVRVLRAGSRIRSRGDRADSGPIGTSPDAACESTEVSGPRGDRSGPTRPARREATRATPSGPPSPDGSLERKPKRRTSFTGGSDELYEDTSHSPRRGHRTGRRGAPPRTREGLVPAADREESSAARARLRGEVAEVRTLALHVCHSTTFQRTAFLQSGRPSDPADHEPRRHAGDLPNDATRSRRPVGKARGAGEIAERNRKGDRGSRGTLTSTNRERERLRARARRSCRGLPSI